VSEEISRQLEANLSQSLDDFRVVVLHGPRQSGKTTLVRHVTQLRGGSYVSLDDEVARDAAINDPLTFLTEQPSPLTIDEVQLGGDRLVRTVKQLVDAEATRGRFLLTGSTNLLTVPVLSESLAGRARILRLAPFSQAELAGQRSDLSTWFDVAPPPVPKSTPSRSDYLKLVCAGGYPEPLQMIESARPGWFESYIETVTQRDIAGLADIRRVAALPRLLRWAAGQTSAELNMARSARTLGISRPTITSYLEWLEAVFLIHQVPSWSRNLSGRSVRRPKIHVGDTGLAANLMGIEAAALEPATSSFTGPLLETFVVNEITRMLSAAVLPVEISHFRDNNQREVDIVLERRDGATIAIEVKSTSSPSADHLRHVKWFRDKLDAVTPGAFRGGILLHTGTQSVTIGDRLHVRPISSLWDGS